jgi:hypothetical protein
MRRPRALSQLRLHKLFHAIEEHFAPEVGHVFDEHLTAGGFPHLRRVQQDMDADFRTLTPVPKTHELGHAGEVRVGSRPYVAQILARR